MITILPSKWIRLPHTYHQLHTCEYRHSPFPPRLGLFIKTAISPSKKTSSLLKFLSMASSFFTSFTHSPLRPSAACPSAQRPNPSVVASATATATDQATALRFSSEMSVGGRRSSFYEVLGIPMTASCREIKAAYRKLARICHPDVVAEKSADEFIKIQTAYSTLSDPDRRANYDREIYRAQLLSVSGLSSSRTPVSSYSGYYTRRNWESDQCW